VSEPLDLVVLGGGIAGLTVAFDALRRRPGTKVVVLEPDAVAGGRIGRAEVAGVVIDTGPDAFLARVPGAVELAGDLGLGDELISPATGEATVWTRGRLRMLPAGVVLGVPSKLGPLARSGILSRTGLARAALDAVWPRRARPGDLSVSEAIGSHLGREVIERLVDPLLGGISAANSDELSLEAAAPQLVAAARSPRLMRALRAQQLAQTRGQIGVNEQRPVFLAPRSGIREMVERLVRALPDGTLLTGVGATSITRHLAGGWTVTGSDGIERRTFAVAVTTPSMVAAKLLRDVSSEAASKLDAIRYASVALTLLAYPRESVTLPRGSGMLVPRVERRFMTAASWWDHKWPHVASPGNVLIRASAGRIDDERFVDMADDEIVRALHSELVEAVGVRSNPVDAHVARWVRSFPQYAVGHMDLVDYIERVLTTEAPGIALAGSAYRGTGIPATIRTALAASAQLVR